MKQNKRKELRIAEDYHLWVACGGVCTFECCNKRLIMSADGYLTNVGQKAHIIGHAKKSARHEFMEEYHFTQDTLETVENLMLMCYEHHKLIDGNDTKENYPPNVLFKMKKDHERWVASWSEKKKSIALVHKRLGGPILDIENDKQTPYILIDAVEDQNEFLDFSEKGWKEGKRNNVTLYGNFAKLIRKSQANIAEIFPLSPIPLLIHLGSLLTDTVPYSIYQFDRESGVWVSDNPGKSKEVKLAQSTKLNKNEELAILISVSGKVHIKDVEEVITNPLDIIDFTIDDPGLKSVLYKDDVLYIQAKVKGEIERLLQQNNYRKLHLFYAGPAGLALELGRGINLNIWSETCLYQYNNRQSPRYQYALSI